MAIKTALLPLFLGASSGIAQYLSDTHINATIPQFTPLTYYSHQWRNSLRALNHDSADLIGLPFPYATPTLKGNQLFQEMYYWDSYFINRGLLAYGTHPQRTGESTADELAAVQQAIHNVNNLLFLVKKLGFVPNANRYSMTNRSQPPLLGAMVADIYRATRDTAWLRQALPLLEKEHDWWMQARSLGLSQREQTIAPNALAYNHYGHNASNAFLLRFGRFLSGRLDEGFDSLLRRENQDSLFYPPKRVFLPQNKAKASNCLDTSWPRQKVAGISPRVSMRDVKTWPPSTSTAYFTSPKTPCLKGTNPCETLKKSSIGSP